MNIGIIVLARYTSSRLPGKALMPLQGRTLLGHVLARIAHAAPGIPLVVATSSDPSDDAIDQYCRRAGVACFRGPLEDVAGRFLDCATAAGWDFAVRINGDNLFVDGNTLREMLAIARTDQFDLVTNVPGRTFPHGMSVEIVRTDFYRRAMASVDSAYHREHVTSWLYENGEAGKRHVFVNHLLPELAGLHLAIDTEDDFRRAAELMHRAGGSILGLGLKEIARLIAPSGKSPWEGKASGTPLLIAEIGGNHEGDFAVAKDLAARAIRSGADCVKFQVLTGDRLVSAIESPVRHAHFQRFELLPEQHIELARMCRDAGVIYCASVWDIESLEWIDEYLDFYKIGSGDLTAWPLLREFARRGKPILLSTGLATLEEVMDTVRCIQAVDARYMLPEYLCVMQCTAMYPIPDAEANLRAMETLGAEAGVEIGYSDHTIGSAALLAATAMGAKVLEFHFTDSRDGKTFRDHKVSLTEDEVRQLEADIARIIAFRGDGTKVPQPSELAEKHEISFRRAAYVNQAVPAGTPIDAAHLVYLRPAVGTDAREAGELVGAIALRDLRPFHALEPGRDYQLTPRGPVL